VGGAIPPLVIHLRPGAVTAAGLRTSVMNALTVAVGNARARIAQWAAVHVPRRTGRLMADVLRTTVEIADRPPIFNVKVGAPNTPYAVYTNRMSGVKWTNPATVEHWFDAVKRFAREAVREAVREQFELLGLTTRVVVSP